MRISRGFTLGILTATLLVGASYGCSYFDGVSISAYTTCATVAASLRSNSFQTFSTAIYLTQIDCDIAIVPIREGLDYISSDQWNYRLERAVQGCNLYYYTTNGTQFDPIPSTAKILMSQSFSAEYECVYDCLGITSDQLVISDDIRSLEESAVTMTYEGEPIYGVVMAEPYLTIALGEATTRDLVPIDQLGRNKMSWNYMYGLFFSVAFETSNRSDSVIVKIDETVRDLSERGGNQTISALFNLDEETCVSRFGATPEIIRGLQLQPDDSAGLYQTSNRLRIVDSKGDREAVFSELSLDDYEGCIGSFF